MTTRLKNDPELAELAGVLGSVGSKVHHVPMTPDQSAGDLTRVAGSRFHRPLTENEMGRIEAAAERTEGEEIGYPAALRELWDILLGAAEGVTMAEAAEAGMRFHPADYAIPQSQADWILEVCHAHPGDDAEYVESRVAQRIAMRWFNIGPASYDDASPGVDDVG